MPRLEFSTSDEFINAKVRGMRSKLFEREQLLELAQCRTLPEVLRRVYPNESFATHSEFERRLIQDHMGELDTVARYLSGRVRDLFAWLMAYYQLTNVKVLLRAYVLHEERSSFESQLTPLPAWMEIRADEVMEAGDLRRLARILPAPEFSEAISAFGPTAQEPDLLRMQTALDNAYYARLVDLSARMGSWTERLVAYDVNTRALMTVLRMKFSYRRPFEEIAPYLVCCAPLRPSAARAVSDASNVGEAVERIPIPLRPAGIAGGTVSLQEVEDAFLLQMYRLGVRCMTESMLDIAAIFGFYYVKRAEHANLLRVKECVRHSLPREQIEKRLLTPHR